ncbi:hypothetical protein B0T20DRAFT_276717 [Sordaria brevicollis]|uniref:Uncharacterized protein n=1 Tax=Sordaria brevicollis TaxID=83679 RepID=A0AAE0UAQ7_SORBR|nr:hypothetical protein B0T20DRAFT_276717 [Sordaria brevicollis]
MGAGEENQSLQRASYGFIIFSRLGPLAAFALLFLYLLIILIWNWIRTRTWKEERSRHLGGNGVTCTSPGQSFKAWEGDGG